MKQYLEALQLVLNKGRFKGDRTGTGTTSYFGHQMRFDLSEGFPLVTTKKVHLKAVIHELLWFLSGDTNIKYLLDNGVHIWDDWCIPEYKEEPLTPSERYDLMETDYPDIHDEYLTWSPYKTEEEKLAWCTEHNIPTTRLVMVAGELGPVYGKQWRSWDTIKIVPEFTLSDDPDDMLEHHPDYTAGAKPWTGNEEYYQQLGYEYEDEGMSMVGGVPVVILCKSTDQIQQAIHTLRTNPTSRRIMVTGWNPALMPIEGASHQENVENGLQSLPPCHTIFQFYAEELTYMERQQWAEQNLGDAGLAMRGHYRDFIMEQCDALNVPKYRLSCQLYQRSADMFLGVPFNIASYALLTMMMAQCVNMVPGEFIHTFGDMHVYSNHMEQVHEQLSREPRPMPKMRINPEVKDLFAFKFEDFTLEDYDPHPAIKGQVAV